MTEIQKIIQNPEYEKAIKETYEIKHKFNKDKNKLRKFEIPNDTLKEKFQRPITLALQTNIERIIVTNCPPVIFNQFCTVIQTLTFFAAIS